MFIDPLAQKRCTEKNEHHQPQPCHLPNITSYSLAICQTLSITALSSAYRHQYITIWTNPSELYNLTTLNDIFSCIVLYSAKVGCFAPEWGGFGGGLAEVSHKAV
jgi:hypothetical protein